MISIGAERMPPTRDMIEALREMFRAGCETPLRHHHTVPVPGEPDATLLLMPAWRSKEHIGVKIVAVFPGNSQRGLAAVNANYLLLSASTGETLAMIDGGELTARRTAAASALAADYLARKDASRLIVVGSGRLAPHLAEAHSAIRPIREITICARNPEKAEAVAESVAARLGVEAQARASGDLESALREADIVSCATLSAEPLVFGKWLPDGIHVDLVGAFTPLMRESDDEAVKRSSVFVDTIEGAVKEAGDIVMAMESGALDQGDVKGDLFGLCRGEIQGRRGESEITLFKSVGTALEDLAGAILAYESARQ